MKKLFLIVLMVAICISFTTDTVLAKVKFGNWDRWDEELPPAENQSWYWAISTNKSREMILKGWGINNDDILLIFSDLLFLGNKKGTIGASVLFYSSGDIENWDIPNASLAIAAFPEKEKLIIRAYKMENKVFKFFEKWEIPCKIRENVVPRNAKFRKELKQWLQAQMRTDMTIPEDMFELILPILLTYQGYYRIINCQK